MALNTTQLTEGVKPTAKALSIGTVTISTQQYGDLISISDLAKVKSPFEIVPIASERLTRQSSETLDQVARDIIAAGGTAMFVNTQTDRADIASTDYAVAADLRKLRAKMFKAKIKPFADGYYRLFISPNVGFDLRNDDDVGGWIDVNKYATPETLLRGELGRMEGFRIMEVVNAPTFASTTTVYASIAVGSTKGWGCGELQTLETFHVAPGGDHTDPLGQDELVGWKVSYGCAVLSNSYYYRLESGATPL